jgi:hypothetical protein
MYDLFRNFYYGLFGIALFWLMVGACTDPPEPVITDSPYRALTALNRQWMGVTEEDPEDWRQYQSLLGETSNHHLALQASLGGEDARPTDWPDGFDWPYDTDKAFSPATPQHIKDAGIRAIDDLAKSGWLARLALARQTLQPVFVYHDTAVPLIDVLLPELGKARSAARHLAMRLALAAERGNEADFLEALKDAQWLAHSTAQSMLIGSLVNLAIHSLVIHEVRFALDSHRFSDPTLVELDALLAAPSPRNVVRSGFLGERHFQADYLQRMFTDDGAGDGHFTCSPASKQFLNEGYHPFADLLPKTGAWAGFIFGSRRDHDAVFDAILADALRALDSPSARETHLHQEDIIHSVSALRFPLVHILIPATGKAVQTAMVTEAHIAGARILIALARFHNANGKDADSLNDLVPAFLPRIPPDPISGLDWVYTRLDHPDQHSRRFLLYSVGGDGVDNGGVHDLAAQGRSTRGIDFDYVINTPRP